MLGDRDKDVLEVEWKHLILRSVLGSGAGDESLVGVAQGHEGFLARVLDVQGAGEVQAFQVV